MKPLAASSIMYSSTGQPQQPMTAPSQWSTGLCDFCNDTSSCCLTCWCPCITFGRIGEIVDKGTTCNNTCYPSNLVTTAVSIVVVSVALFAKEYRELKYRGFEPSLGWEGNLARQNQGVVMPPIGPKEMTR